MDNPLPITVCTLCLNEAENLPRCLKLREAFDEWIVLDTGSSDRSIQIAEALGARVEKTIWLNFAATRKYHFSLARNRWILWIDADEEITPAFVEELRQLMPKIEDHSAYRFNRQMFFEWKWIRHGDWFPDRVTRLFRAGDWHMPDRKIHESLEINGTIGNLKTLVPHFSYSSWADRSKRIESYSELWAQQEKFKGRKVGIHAPFLRATWKLFRGLILKKGFLDGRLGFKIALSNAWEVHQKYRTLRIKNLNGQSQDLDSTLKEHSKNSF